MCIRDRISSTIANAVQEGRQGADEAAAEEAKVEETAEDAE